MTGNGKNPVLALVGDIALSGLFVTRPEKNRERLAAVSTVLQKSELVFANLEAPLQVNEERNEYKNFIHFSDRQVSRDLLQLLHIGCVSLANNHIYDCKMSGLEATIDLLDELGIFHSGAGYKQEHIEPVVIDLPGGRIGFMAYVDRSTNPKTENFPELLINYFDLEKVREDIIGLRPRVNKLICSIHWGRDYSFYPTARQLLHAKSLIDAGADIVMGHHPHTIQGYEIYKNSHIFYSLGSLTYGDFIWKGKLRALKRKTKIGMIAEIETAHDAPAKLIACTELIGNKVILINKNLPAWSRRHLKMARLMAKSRVVRSLVYFKESWLDRIVEVFIGYYRKPLRDLLAKLPTGK